MLQILPGFGPKAAAAAGHPPLPETVVLPEPACPALLQFKIMQTLKFKTNINCGGCIKAVTPALNGEKAIQSWQVDTDNPDKILTLSTDLSAAQVEALIAEAGFEAQAA